MPFKTTEELKKFLSPESYICLRCQNVSTNAIDHKIHLEIHAEHDELEKLRALKDQLDQMNAKPNPELERMLENEVKI